MDGCKAIVKSRPAQGTATAMVDATQIPVVATVNMVGWVRRVTNKHVVILSAAEMVNV
jgi:hypothetical protein